MRGLTFAAAVAVAVGVSLAGPASADAVIFSGTGTDLAPVPLLYALPGAGTYDFTLQASRLASYNLQTSYDRHVDYYKAPPAFPHDSNLLTGNNGPSLGGGFYNNVMGFAFTLVVPEDTLSSFISDGFWTAYGIPVGSTLYTTVRYEDPGARLNVFVNNADPLEYTFTITRRDDAPAPVPEPAAWALMILGFGAVGGAMRARRRDLWAAT
jgi:hypothetical protein